MIFDAQNGCQLAIRGIPTALKMLNLPPKHPIFTFEAKKPLKHCVGAHFEHQKSFIYIKTWFFVLFYGYSQILLAKVHPHHQNPLCKPSVHWNDNKCAHYF